MIWVNLSVVALTTQEQRVQAKIAELAGTSLEIKRSALMVKLGAFKKGGKSALIDGRAFRAVKKHVSEPDPIVEALQIVMTGQRHKSTGTKKRLMSLLFIALTKQHGRVHAEALMFSTSTLYRLIEELDAGRHTTGSAKTRQSLAGRPNRTFTQNIETFADAEVQLDSTKLDVLVTIPGYDGPQRVILT